MQDPIFVVGTGRSGTTITARCVGAHPKLLLVDEPRFLNHLLLPMALYQLESPAFEHGLKISDDGSGKEPMKFFRRMAEHYGERLGASGLANLRATTLAVCLNFRDELRGLGRTQRLATLRRTVHRLMKLTQNSLGREVWLVKQPDLCCCLNEMAEIFPESRFVHVMRSPVDVISSRLERGFQADFESAFQVWHQRLRSTAAFVRRHRDRVIDVRFETLVAQPVELLNNVLQYLGLPLAEPELLSAAREICQSRGHLNRGRSSFTAVQRSRLRAACADIDALAGGGWLPKEYLNDTSRIQIAAATFQRTVVPLNRKGREG